MSTSPKLPVQSARKGSATLKSSKPPQQQFDPRHKLERKGQASNWCWQGALQTTIREAADAPKDLRE